MPKIAREDHPKILHMADVEGLKAAEIAAQFGCTPANIYALLTKLRREREGAAAEAAAPITAESAVKMQAAIAAPPASEADLFDTFSPREEPVAAAEPIEPEPVLLGAVQPVAPATTEPAPSSGAPHPQALSAPARPPATAKEGAKSKAGKMGIALVMRTSDGEEAINPFRSLDELLAAAKPILRTAARNPETVWFSIQTVDLEAVLDEVF